MSSPRNLYPLLCAMALLTLLCSVQMSAAATFYVATNGNDKSAGTAAQPFRTLLKGVRALKAGDTLLVKGGTYREVLLDVIPSGTSWSRPVTVKAAPGETVVLQAPATSDAVVAFVKTDTSYIILDGFVLDANRLGAFAFIVADGAHHIRVANCEMKNARSSGLLVGPGGATPGTVRGCCNEMINLDVHDNGSTKYHHGIYLASTNNLVEHSRFYRNAGYGIHNYNSKGGANDNTLRANRVSLNGSGGIWVGSGVRHVVANNLVWENGHGIILSGANAKLYNNTIYGNKGTRKSNGTIDAKGVGIIILNSDDHGTEIANNIAYQNPGGAISGVRSAVLRNNLWTEDPQFVNARQADFRLQLPSPAVDKGKTVGLVSTDYEGVRRPQGPEYDIGAHEHRAVTVPAPRNLSTK